MSTKRPPISFPALEARGKRAILRDPEEIRSEQEELARRTGLPPDVIADVQHEDGEEQPLTVDTIRQERAALRVGPQHRRNFLLTGKELMWLGRTAMEASRRLGRRISSDDIVRVAIQLAKEEYLMNGDEAVLFELLEEIPK
ncbi:MAG: hypothetical protein NVSMB65_01090 [Chloroflexota bacterium]